jgi:cell wall-associated NlpC family hydrolase
MSRATHAVVSLPALDVRRRADHRAELTSQLLLGEIARILGRTTGTDWWRVENLADGYRGWVRGWGLVRVPATRARSWQSKATATVVWPVVDGRVAPGRGSLVSPLFLASRVIPGRRSGTYRRVELPDGRRCWLPDAALSGRGRGIGLVDRVTSLLGVPYHWGGRTALGLDCSAFAQLVLGEQGIALPRDARRQFHASRPLPDGEEPGPGDLVFFAAARRPPSHVGIGLGGGYFAHCRGVVRISSLEPLNSLCDNELSCQYLAWRRPHGALPTAPGGGGRGESA